MRTSCVLTVALLLGLAGCGKREATPATPATAPTASAAPAATAAAAAAATPAKDAVFGPPELDQMVAPIALYPDPLLAQVLMASTYPGDVADAAAWSKLHLDVKGDAAVKQVASQPWDPSVQALVAFPQALDTLAQDPAWVQRLGDAFLAQPDDVMDAVQRLRHKAQAAGHLESNKYQTVSAAPAPAEAAPAGGEAAPMEAAPMEGGMESGQSSDVIVIAPSDPEVVYVPSYNPNEVYGNWAYPSYPPPYYPPSPMYTAGTALLSGLAFGAGIAITNSLWGDMDWGGNDININSARYNTLNVNNNFNGGNNLNGANGAWRHNAANRDGVPYRDRASREQYDRRLPGAESRDSFRGEDAQRSQAREQARSSMEKRGVQSQPGGARAGAGGADRDQARERARTASADNASRERARQQIPSRDQANAVARDRQAASRQSASRQGGSHDAARRQQANQNYQARGASTSQSRQAAHRQQSAQAGAHNNAFQGARQPQQSRQQAQRGQASHAQARQASSAGGGRGGGHSGGGRPAGQPVQRSAPPPRQGGGGRHR